MEIPPLIRDELIAIGNACRQAPESKKTGVHPEDRPADRHPRPGWHRPPAQHVAPGVHSEMKPMPVKIRPDHAALWRQIGDTETGPYACERAEARAFVEWVRYNVPTHIAVYRTDRDGGVWFARLARK